MKINDVMIMNDPLYIEIVDPPCVTDYNNQPLLDSLTEILFEVCTVEESAHASSCPLLPH